MPRTRSPSVVVEPRLAPRARKGERGSSEVAVGVSRALLEPPFVDRRRRLPETARPAAFGHTLIPGERFKFDVTFAGNPAGLAEAEVVALEQDPRGHYPAGAPLLRLQGHARTSGIVSLLATVTDDIVSLVDARTGAAVFSENVLHYSGWSPTGYKHRVTTQVYEGRGQVRITDTKDEKSRRKLKRAPLDTFDPMSAMAWVRSLDLTEGHRAKAHAVDGMTLLRIEIESRGVGVPSPMPSIARALGLGPEDITRIDGVLTRVDEYDQAVPGKRAYALRAWISNDTRRIPLVLESDMWVGAIRLELTSYDPPSPQAAAEMARVLAGAGLPGKETSKDAP